jgi:glycosyltransferase involved in cell wall biosynthesis
MAEAIVAEGHEVHVVTYHIGENIPVRGPKLHRIPRLTRESKVVVGPTARRPLYDAQMVFKTLQVVRRHQPDLLHAHGYEAALVAASCRLATGLPVVYSGHNTMGDELASYNFIRPRWVAAGLAKLLDAVVPRLGDRCIPHSTNIRHFFQRLGLGRRSEPIVNFGIDVDWVRHGDSTGLRERYGLGTGPVILYTGVLDQFQRIDLLLEAFAQLRVSETSAKLLIVSTIPHAGHAASIRGHAQKLGIAGSVVLTDPQPIEAVRDFLQVGDVAVVPRPGAPGFPIKLLNYMAAARPCVLFASSASKGLRHRENVYLASPDTSTGLCRGLAEVLHDEALRRRLAVNAYRFVRWNHSRQLMAQQVCASYFRTLAATDRLSGVLKRQHPSNLLRRQSFEAEQHALDRIHRLPDNAIHLDMQVTRQVGSHDITEINKEHSAWHTS